MATFKDFIQPISNFIKIAEAKKKEIQECIDEYNTKNTDEKENFLEILNNLLLAYDEFINILKEIIQKINKLPEFISSENYANSDDNIDSPERLVKRYNKRDSMVSSIQYIYIKTSGAFLDLKSAFNENSGTMRLKNPDLMEKCSSFQWDETVSSKADLMVEKLGDIAPKL